MVGKGGAALAEINADVVGGVPDDVLSAVEEREAAIKAGTFRVDITETTPRPDPRSRTPRLDGAGWPGRDN